MATSLKLMDGSKKGARVRCLTQQTSDAWHRTLHGFVGVTKKLLGCGVKYVCQGTIQSDRLEGEFGVIRGMFGGNYLIAAEQVFSGLALRRLKLYHVLDIDPSSVITAERKCCAGKIGDRDEDLFLLDESFTEGSNLTENEISILYYISGYVTFKEDLETYESEPESLPPASEFTDMLTRGKLKHPPADLYDLSKYLYAFFKMRSPKCCNEIFLQGFKIIYEHSGCEYKQCDSIIRRFVNSFFSAFAKDQTDKIKQSKELQSRKKRKLNSDC